MSLVRETSASRYPDVQFDTDFDVYLHVASDFTRKRLKQTLALKPLVTEVEDVDAALHKGLTDLAESVAYGLAAPAHRRDSANNDTQRFAHLLLQLSEYDEVPNLSDPEEYNRPEDLLQNDSTLIDAMRMKPKTDKGEFLQWQAEEWVDGNDGKLQRIAQILHNNQEG